MRAMRVIDTEEGPGLISAQVPRPEPTADQVLIRVHAAGVTHSELTWYSTTHDKEGLKRTGAIPGHEFSGVIAALGRNVEGFEVGDEVYGMSDWFADGALAEYCVTLPQNVARKPVVLSHQAAATVPISALTAWQGLFDRAAIQAGERVLIHGGAGAVGLFAVQLACRQGAYVIATVSARDRGLAGRLGASEVIDYRATRFEEVLGSVDVVFDTVGGETLIRSWKVLSRAGRAVTIAVESEGSPDQRVKESFFIVTPNQMQLTEVATLIDAGRLKTFVRAVVSLEGASAAYDGSLRNGSGRGKIVVAIPERRP